jgi:hypothetical protein
MDTSEVHTDGNGVAGMLQQIFVTEITTARRVCDSCGEEHPIGAHRAYSGAGTVLRCPACGDVAARIVSLPDRFAVQLRGTWTLELPRGG